MLTFKVVIELPIDTVNKAWYDIAPRMINKNWYRIVPVVQSAVKLCPEERIICTIIEGSHNALTLNESSWRRVVMDYILTLCYELGIGLPTIEFKAVEAK